MLFSLLARLAINNLLLVKTISCKILYVNIVNFVSIIMDKVKVFALAIRPCFVVGSVLHRPKLLWMALALST